MPASRRHFLPTRRRPCRLSSRPCAASGNVYKWRRMKVDAHPLLVAVALGLLGPAVLETEDDRDDSESMLRLEPSDVPKEWEPGPAPDPEEFHRVELQWTEGYASS